MSFRGKFPPNINRPPFQPFGMRQFTPQPRPYVNRVLFNDAPIDQSIISKLFLLIQEDNFKKLQEFINENGITTNSMIDDNGQTIVHVITSSQNLSVVTKKQLLKYLKTIGSMINVQDKTGTTPLHIACKNQDFDLVKELLYSYNVNLKDNNGKTALHYAVMGVFDSCLSKNPSDTVFEEKPRITDTIQQSDFSNLAKKIHTYMTTEDTIKNYLDHVAKSIGIINKIYRYDINEIIEKNNKEYFTILTSADSNEEKIKQVRTKITNSIIDLLLKNKLKDVLSEYQINEDPARGWSPDNDSRNKVLKESDLTEYTIILDQKNKEFKYKIYDIFTNFKFFSILVDLNNFNIDQHTIIALFVMINKLMEIINKNTHKIKFIDSNNTNTANNNFFNNFTQLQKLCLDTEDDHHKFKAYNENSNINNINEFDIKNDTNYANNNLIVDGNNRPLFNTSNIIYRQNDEYLKFHFFLLLQEIKKNSKNKQTIEENNPTIIDTNKIYFSLKLKNILSIISSLYDSIFTKIYDIYSDNVTNDKIVFELNNIVNLSINIILLLSELKKEIDYVINKIEVIKEDLKQKIQLLSNKGIDTTGILNTTQIIINGPNNTRIGLNQQIDNINADAFYRALLTYIDENIFKQEKKYKQIVSDMFDDIKDIFKVVNNFIELENKKYAKQYITTYFDLTSNNYKNFTTGMIIDDIYINTLSQIRPFFQTYQDLEQIISSDNNDIEKNKKKLFELFIQQIHNNYIISRNDSTGVETIPTIGYLVEDNVDDIDPNLIAGSTSNDTDILKNSQNDKKTKNTYLKAIIGIRKNQPLRTDSVFESITEYFNEHLKTLKYVLMREIITHIKTQIDSPTGLDAIKTIDDNIRTTLGLPAIDTDRRIIYSMIVKIVDNLYTQYIKDSIILSVTNFRLDQIKAFDKPTLSVFLDKSKINLSFGLVNKEFSKDILKLYTNIQDKILLLGEKITRDISGIDIKGKLRKFYTKVFMNQQYEGCIRFNENIVEELLRHNADINAIDKDLNTPIVYALINSNFDCVEYLLNKSKIKKSAITKQRNISGKTPFDILVELLQNDLDLLDKKTYEQSVNERFRDELISKTQVEKIVRNQDKLLKILIYLINTYFYYNINDSKKKTNLDLVDLKQEKTLSLLESITDTPVDDFVNLFYAYKKADKDKDNSIQVKTDITTYIKKINTQKTNLKLYINNVISTFESVINDVINDNTKRKDKNYRLYIILWNYFLDNTNLLDKDENTLVSKMLNQVINKLSKKDITYKDKKVEKLEETEIDFFSNNIATVIDEYFSKPVYYNKDVNKELFDMINIINHVLQNSVFTNLYYLVLKLLRYQMVTLDPTLKEDTKNADFEKKISEIIEEIPLEEYIFKTIPIKCIKRVLEIYESDSDPDKSVNILSLLGEINNILQRNTKTQIPADSEIMRKLTSNIYPFFEQYIILNIRMLKQVTDGYFCILANISKNVEMLKLFQEKREAEDKDAYKV